ncbi:4'-phosphopantetheinyl transferase [Pluteus cervinus]|uniref:4'-phosphopantetheinyl transferase n=1 Tax=Pluteus cervinus TaxID=181527 RepID=A0ACD3BEV7_9AGAR|nr:4'-phosphopantetheinyl transferase [Pluteus cervinus]
MLNERGIPLNDMSFATTDTGKPYVSCVTDPPIAYNVTHDNALIALAFAPGRVNGPAFNVGIDVMKVRVPGRQDFPAFVETFSDQLTALERGLLRGVPQEEALRRFFWMWTMKEAYTKALGLGLGFDFSRVEFDVVGNTVRVDGQIPQGWWFGRFVIQDGQDTYEGVVAELVGGDGTVLTPETESPDWLHIFDAATFTEKTIQELQPHDST